MSSEELKNLQSTNLVSRKYRYYKNAIISTIVSIILIIIGIFIIIKMKPKRTSVIEGIITNNPNCSGYQLNRDQMWKCNLVIKYTIDGLENSISLETNSSTKYSKDKTVSIYYNPNNIDNIALNTDDIRHIGKKMAGVGLLIIIINIAYIYYINKYYSYI